jgi:hypothetical protein
MSSPTQAATRSHPQQRNFSEKTGDIRIKKKKLGHRREQMEKKPRARVEA